MEGVRFNLVAMLKRADEEGRLVPAIVLPLTVVALLPAFSRALAALERAPAPVRLRVFLEGFPEHLTVHISVYNLTEKGAVGVARASVRGPQPPEGLTFDFAVHKIRYRYRSVYERFERVWYEIYPFNVFAYAYDPERRELHVASTYVTVSPERYEYVVELKARRAHSSQVSIDQVPAPGQCEQILDLSADNVIIVAWSVPEGALFYIVIPPGINVPVEAFERMYWTDDPTFQTWVDEGWESKGYVGYTTDGGVEGYSGGSLYDYPTNVDYVVSTVYEPPPPLYIVRVLRYPRNINHNTNIASGQWSPCSGGTLVTEITRPDSTLHSWQKYVGFRVHLKEITVTFVTITQKKIPIPLPIPRIVIEPQYITLGVKVEDWSKAPSNANRLRVYACDSANLQVRAQYEP